MHIHRAMEYVKADEQAFRSSDPTKLIYMDWEHGELRYWIYKDGINDENNESDIWNPTLEDLVADDWEYYPCKCPIYQEFLDEDAKRNQNT